MARRDSILNVLDDYSTRDLISIVSSINCQDGSLENMDWHEMDMWEIWQSVSDSSTFEEIVQQAANGDFNPRDDYYRFDSFGDLESSDDPDFDLEEIADWIDDNFGILRRVIGDYYAEDFEDCEGDPLDPETIAEIENEIAADTADRMSVERIAATIRECTYEGLTRTENLSDEQINLLAKVIADKHICLDPADVIAAVDEEYRGAA